MQPLPNRPYRVALVGAGRVGTAVAEVLRDRGHDVVGVWSRTNESAEVAAARLAARVRQTAADAANDANVILIGTSDDAVGPVVAELAPGARAGSVTIHFAGSLGIDALAPAAPAGCHLAALHPVQALPDADTARARLPGSAWGVTCSEGAVGWAHDLVEVDLAGTPVDVAEVDRPIWHAAAVLTSNGIAALVAEGATLLRAIGVADAVSVLGPLATGTVANLVAGGVDGRAFTGPAVRGDVETIARHVRAIGARLPDLLEPYARASLAIVDGAVRAERIDESAAASMRALLESA